MKYAKWIIENFNCIDPERTHSIRMYYYEKCPDELYVNLCPILFQNFFTRLYVGLKYIFRFNRISFIEKILKITSTYNYDEYDFDVIWDIETVNKAILFLKKYRHEYFKNKEIENNLNKD